MEERKRWIDYIIGKPSMSLIINSDKGLKPVNPGILVDTLVDQTKISMYVKYYDSLSSFYLYNYQFGVWEQVSLITLDAFLTEL